METTEDVYYNGHTITADVINDCNDMVLRCIDQMDADALKEFSGGYDNDINKLIQKMTCKVIDQLILHKEHTGGAVYGLSQVDSAMEETMRCENLIYFIRKALGKDFDVSWHHIEWARMSQEKKFIVILASRDHGKSYFFSNAYPLWKLYRHGKIHTEPDNWKGQGFLFSHTEKKAFHFLNIIKENILHYPVLRERLFKEKAKWSASEIKLKNGTSIIASGFLGSTRGYHPEWCVVDDALTDATIYSPAIRQKANDYFFSVIVNMVVPQGQIICVGTPFHNSDLYSEFRKPEKRKIWAYKEYPAVSVEGELLWSDRYDYDELMVKRAVLGNIIFSREFLCRPIASDSTLFPWSVLSKSITGTEDYKLVNNIEASPMSFTRVVVGCDFALSANVGADFTVFTVWGIDEQETMWLLHVWRRRGATFNEQIVKIKTIATNFRPAVMILETVNFQSIYAQFLEDTAIPIKPHNTGVEKHLKDGIPSLSVLFERGKMKLPTGDEHSKNMADIILGEFNNMTYAEKGITSISGHDDCCMSVWFAKIGAMTGSNAFNYEFI